MPESSHVHLVVESAALAAKVGAEFVEPEPVEVKWPDGCQGKLMPADWSVFGRRPVVSHPDVPRKVGAGDTAYPEREVA